MFQITHMLSSIWQQYWKVLKQIGTLEQTLRKILKFHLMCWHGTSVCGNFAFPQNFNNRKLRKISVFYTVSHLLPVFCCDTEKLWNKCKQRNQMRQSLRCWSVTHLYELSKTAHHVISSFLQTEKISTNGILPLRKDCDEWKLDYLRIYDLLLYFLKFDSSM